MLEKQALYWATGGSKGPELFPKKANFSKRLLHAPGTPVCDDFDFCVLLSHDLQCCCITSQCQSIK